MPEETRLTPDLIAAFTDIVGASHALLDPDAQLPYLREMRDQWKGRSALVLRPASTDEVSRIMALAHRHKIAVVPQSGNTGLVGGQVPMQGEILLSLSRMKAVRALDPVGFTMTVEAGLTLEAAQAAAQSVDRFFPLTLPSQGSCQIGGNLSTNAGGVGVLAYGNARAFVLGLEVVLADGRIWNGLTALKKDNTGYALKDLFVGAEGTLGIITAAVLRIFPRPAETVTALVAIPSIEAARTLFVAAQDRAGSALTAFEFMPRIVIDFVLKHVAGTRDPFDTAHPWYVLTEFSAAKADGTAERSLTEVLEAGIADGIVIDARVAASLAQARDFWKLREAVSEAQKPEGGSIKHDVSVPVASIPEFVGRANAAVGEICPGARYLAFGHFGDGNVHYNIAQPIGMPRPEFEALRDRVMHRVHSIVVEMGGSISAEHGIGQLKRHELAEFKDPVALDLMRRIKAALDPDNILNPGKVL
ncbi:MAG: FAD-binding oxidoreductase [Hyphomicrobiales bacterium]|nr:MAG: FAD-binding oxidoreductase [Hyphomicrobiales bacterium]